MFLLLEEEISTYITWNSSTKKMYLFSSFCKIIQSFIYNQRDLMDIYFILWVQIVTLHCLLCCLNCSALGHWVDFQHL